MHRPTFAFLSTVLLLLALLTEFSKAPVTYAAETSSTKAESSTTKPLEATITQTQYPAKQQEAEAILSRLIKDNKLNGQRIQKITVVGEDHINAATDGNQIYFYEGLWDKLTTADQKAFVISHEMAHVYSDHVIKGAGRQLGLNLLSHFISKRFLADGSVKSQLLRVATQSGVMLTDLRFTRQNEYQADELGLNYMKAAHYNPQAAIEALDLIGKLSPSSTPQFLRSHPISVNRIQALIHQANKAS